MPGFVNSIFETFGIRGAEDEMEIIEETDKETQTLKSHSDDNYQKRGKIVKFDATAKLDVVILQPEKFDDAQDVANAIKSKRPCVMNLERVPLEVERRIVDFVSGVVYAIDGNIQRVSKGIFLVAPYNVSIMGDIKKDLRTSLFA